MTVEGKITCRITSSTMAGEEQWHDTQIGDTFEGTAFHKPVRSSAQDFTTKADGTDQASFPGARQLRSRIQTRGIISTRPIAKTGTGTWNPA